MRVLCAEAGSGAGLITRSRGSFRRSIGVSFHIAPGETSGVAGPTSAGKSTLSKLLLLARGGTSAELWHIQSGELEEAGTRA